jgi:hypothetical protein
MKASSLDGANMWQFSGIGDPSEEGRPHFQRVFHFFFQQFKFVSTFKIADSIFSYFFKCQKI